MYEVIQEGLACKLYFDIEYGKDHNPEVDGSKVLSTFIQYVCYQMKLQFNIDVNKRRILDLESGLVKNLFVLNVYELGF